MSPLWGVLGIVLLALVYIARELGGSQEREKQKELDDKTREEITRAVNRVEKDVSTLNKYDLADRLRKSILERLPVRKDSDSE